ncbi:molybdenum cofactor biosynthesis protein c, putative [Bodo saltans]|uniref:Molybdenum cofactor biosynthesis protein c, putative n=1 Tax=Bodo saltans TaxID=75058 RepID=A0A0S4JP13_BODSA|nr:molybdenum cofactor biosynthesis protein c, putative [Bodo saltans]|eukprot:CUG92400.1 molybdenum cofactor biosynthesis protein c, putative [Bodo saltans]
MLKRSLLQFAKKRALGTSRTSSACRSTHVDKRTGLPTMVNIQAKIPTERVAIAESRVFIPRSIALLFQKRRHKSASRIRRDDDLQEAQEHLSAKKGPVLSTAVIAGTLGTKLTSQLIPFCHPVPLEHCKFNILVSSSSSTGQKSKRAELVIRCLAATTNKTGVEMEAMVGASTCALTIYDMLKGVDGAQKSGNLFIAKTRLLWKAGGKSGDIHRKGLIKDNYLNLLFK